MTGYGARSILGIAALVLLLAAVAGCSGQRAAAFEPAVVGDGEGVIYIFREPKAFDGSKVQVFMDQEEVGVLKRGEHFALVVPAGEYLVRVEGVSSVTGRVRVLDGASAYVNVLTGWGPKPKIERPLADEAMQLVAQTARKSVEFDAES